MKIFPRFQYDEEIGCSACRNQRVTYCKNSTVFNQMYYYYRGPGSLAGVWFGSSYNPPPPPISKVSLFLNLPLCRWSNLLTRWGKEGLMEEPNHTTTKQPGPRWSIQYSLFVPNWRLVIFRFVHEKIMLYFMLSSYERINNIKTFHSLFVFSSRFVEVSHQINMHLQYNKNMKRIQIREQTNFYWDNDSIYKLRCTYIYAVDMIFWELTHRCENIKTHENCPT